MSMEGIAGRGMAALQAAIDALGDDIDISLTPIDTLRG
jgi:hypothetical protein